MRGPTASSGWGVAVIVVITAGLLTAQGPQFEVASVKLADTTVGSRVNGWNLRAGRIRLINQTLEQIFTAVREQLGLRLVPETGPVEFLVIESVEKPDPD